VIEPLEQVKWDIDELAHSHSAWTEQLPAEFNKLCVQVHPAPAERAFFVVLILRNSWSGSETACLRRSGTTC